MELTIIFCPAGRGWWFKKGNLRGVSCGPPEHRKLGTDSPAVQACCSEASFPFLQPKDREPHLCSAGCEYISPQVLSIHPQGSGFSLKHTRKNTLGAASLGPVEMLSSVKCPSFHPPAFLLAPWTSCPADFRQIPFLLQADNFT